MRQTKTASLQQYVELLQYSCNITFISTYIPRRCGIATYTKDLSEHMNMLTPHHLCRIVAMSDSQKEPVTYPWEVIASIEKNMLSDYKRAATFLNTSSSDVICLQHEYGIFGGKDGEYILTLLRQLHKPVISTFHTILEIPSNRQKKILQEIARASIICVVMAHE